MVLAGGKTVIAVQPRERAASSPKNTLNVLRRAFGRPRHILVLLAGKDQYWNQFGRCKYLVQSIVAEIRRKHIILATITKSQTKQNKDGQSLATRPMLEKNSEQQ
jgi:hypothetical protein